MSGEVYFILIRDFEHKRKLDEVIAWLEKNVVLGHGEAEQVESALPFEIPMGFPGRQDAIDFSATLAMLGCVIEIESLSERKARAKAVEAAVAAEIEKAEEPKKPKEPKPEKPKAKNPAQQREQERETPVPEEAAEAPQWIKPAAIALAVALLLAVGWMTLRDVDTEDIKEWSDKIDLDIISMVQTESSSGSPFSQVVSNMQRHIEQQNLTQEERIDNSSTYLNEVKGEKPVKNRETRHRNIMIIQASIAFYKKNAKAWKRLSAEYAAIGATLKVEEIRKEMVEIFGEEETAEILEESE